MRKIVDSILKSLSEFFKKMSKRDRIRLAVLAGVIIALSIIIAAVLGRTTYETLFAASALDSASSGQVINELDTLQVKYKVESTGAIMVEEGTATQLRMQLATLGYGTSNGFSYELYGGMVEGFGKTDLEKQSGLLAQTQQNVRQQLNTMEKIQDCLVLINLPDTSSFVLSTSDEVASAAVQLVLKQGATLTDSEVSAIAHLVSAGTSVPIENISITDKNMKLYNVGSGGNEATSTSEWTYQIDTEAYYREKLENQVLALLTPVFGSDKIRVSVGLTLNFDDVEIQSVEFAPPVEDQLEGLVISMSELYEYTTDYTAGGIVGTDENGLGVPEYPYGTDDGYNYRHIARDVNYEINETVKSIKEAKATIKDLSISVLVDSKSIESDYTENVQNLVVNAIGVNSNYVTVERLPFQTDASFAEEIARQEAALKRQHLLMILELVLKAVLILIAILAVVSFLRTLLKGFIKQEEPVLAAAGVPVGTIGEGIEYISDDDLSDVLYSGEEESDIDLSGKTENIANLEKFIDKDSKAIAQLLRNWLIDEE